MISEVTGLQVTALQPVDLKQFMNEKVPASVMINALAALLALEREVAVCKDAVSTSKAEVERLQGVIVSRDDTIRVIHELKQKYLGQIEDLKIVLAQEKKKARRKMGQARKPSKRVK